jgi:hypothetical protein
VHARLEELVRRGVRKRALKGAGAELFPSLVMGMAKALMVRQLFEGIREDGAAQADRLVDVFLHGAASR